MQLAMHMVTIEDLMPQEHLLRKLETALDLSFVYEETAPLYSKIRLSGHRPGGHREVPAGGVPVRHPVGEASAGYFGNYLKKSCASALKRALSAGVWSARTRPM